MFLKAKKLINYSVLLLQSVQLTIILTSPSPKSKSQRLKKSQDLGCLKKVKYFERQMRLKVVNNKQTDSQ